MTNCGRFFTCTFLLLTEEVDVFLETVIRFDKWLIKGDNLKSRPACQFQPKKLEESLNAVWICQSMRKNRKVFDC